MYWDQQAETMDRAALERQQLADLNATLQQARKASFYKKTLEKLPADGLQDLAAIADLPFTSKQDLRDHFPYGFLAVPLEETVRLHSSSGTTGNPTVVFHTQQDLDLWSDIMARCLYMAGVRKSDVFQNMMGYGLFTGGLGLHYGAERLGALVMPVGPGNSKRQIWFMQTFGTTAVHILPSYAFRLGAVFREMGLNPATDTKLKTAIIGAEPHTEGMRRQIEQLWGIKAFNSYGLSEMCGPGVALECPEQDGIHVWEDHYYMEVINPETGQVLPEGEEGELVLTTLKRTAMPLIRYRTRDLTRIISGSCACGRTHRRIERIKGRSDDMLIINGVNIFPMQIERTLMQVPNVGSHYVIEVHKEKYMDKLHVKVEMNEKLFSSDYGSLEDLQDTIAAGLRNELGVNPKVFLVEPGTLPVSEGKAQRVYDHRTQQ